MSGINSIVGLNKVDLDYRPEIKNPTDKNGADKVQNGANDNIISTNVNVEPVQEEVPLEKSEGRSVLQQLDVLLLNAANRSIAEDASQKTRAIGKTLQELGVITKAEANNIATLSTVASGMLAALDKYTGAEIAGDAAKDTVKAAIDWRRQFNPEGDGERAWRRFDEDRRREEALRQDHARRVHR